MSTDYPGDLRADIERYEAGEMPAEEQVAFFQRLIDCGRAWTLPGAYGRFAAELIEAGLCTSPEESR